MVKTPSDFFETDAFYDELVLNAKFITRLAAIFSIASVAGGFLVPLTASAALYIVFGICCVIPVFFLVINIILMKLYMRKYNDMTVAESMDFLLAHREHADQTAAKKLKLLKSIRYYCKIYAATLGIFGAAVGFLSGVIGWIAAIPTAVYAFYLLLCAFSNIEFRVPESFFNDMDSSIKQKDYPELFSMARDAADKLGCKKKIRIVLSPEYYISTTQSKEDYCLFIGAPILNHWNREELYAAFLHEFGHLMDENRADWAERYYVVRLSHRTPHFFGNLTWPMYCWLDSVYSVQFNLYSHATALKIEQFSDSVMSRFCDVRAAASSLIKFHFYRLYEWGKYSQDSTPLYTPEEPNLDFERERFEDFLAAIEKNKEFWLSLIPKEIISRNATHPTLKMRLDALGVTEYDTLPYNPDGIYADECRKATEFLHSLLTERLCYNYDNKRYRNYLKFYSKIKKWENEGKPLNATDYRDTTRNLRCLGKMQEADELCLRVINEIPHPANVYAHYLHGLYLLHKFDPEGLRYAYKAIDFSTNYAPNGLPVIEQYCCIVGDREELEKCLEKTKVLVQRSKDIRNNIFKLAKKREKLLPEQLPKELLEGILDYVKSIEDGKISRIYAAKREIPGEEPRTIIAITFKIGTEDKDIERIMHRLHLYLDTATEWHFALRTYADVAKSKIEKVKDSLIYKA